MDAPDAVGAIVVPGLLGESFARAVKGREGWMGDSWSVTEYEIGVAPRSSEDVFHAVHLLSHGARLLNILSKQLPQSSAGYNLAELLSVNQSAALSACDLTPMDEKVLRVLAKRCAYIGKENLGQALWIPGLSPASKACSRLWEDALYEAWQHHATALPASRFTFIELFAGIGGFRLGLEPLGGRCVLACELNIHSRATYVCNFQESTNLAQPLIDATCVETAKIPPFDILTAGFPCQSFTARSRERRGLEDDNGQLFYQVIRVLRDCKPKAALLENVTGLLSIRKGADFKQIVNALQSVGYAVGWQTVSAEHFVPQKRIRVYIVCIRRDLYEGSRLEIVSDVHSKHATVGGESVIKWLELDSEAASGPPFSDIQETDDQITEAYTLSEKQWADVLTYESTCGKGRDVSERFVRLDGQARTVTASYRQDFKAQAQFVAQPNSRPRFFTPREVARLMGFPDTFQPSCVDWQEGDGPFYRQFGNSVVPAVVQKVGERVLATLNL
eukprot:TRINITY_DN19945_c0_g2_i1.p1 TRINITY_DN19945_c0_g2~~TRINITY_DN19945_c0_g2_i1.p1  ORF type:complete len:502 (+),score=35.44 TRINITY_DN19945_c0_g2_i1:83-1588(+)